MVLDAHKIWERNTLSTSVAMPASLLPQPPVFVQMGFWIQDKILNFLALQFILLDLVHCLSLSKSVELFNSATYDFMTTTWMKMKNLIVTAPGISLHTDTSNDSQPSTNRFVLHLLSHQTERHSVICHVAKCLSKAWLFTVFRISLIHWFISILSKKEMKCSHEPFLYAF